jgi:hypothetical protein
MNVDGLTPEQVRLLTHAKRMGGWVSAESVRNTDDWYEAMPDLAQLGLFEFQPKALTLHVARYALTPAGFDVARAVAR